MAKKPSKKSKKSAANLPKVPGSRKISNLRKTINLQKVSSPHKSFRRTYREDYLRETNVPSITKHVFATFKTIFQNWRLFLPLLLLALALDILFVGLMSEDTYTNVQTVIEEGTTELYGSPVEGLPKAGLILISSIVTGGLSGEAGGASGAFLIIIFLILWLTTIYLLRFRLAKREVKLRDGLYNAMTPLVSTFIVFLVAVIQCIPIAILVITYSAAVQTELFANLFYGFLYVVFAALMILLSGYLLSSTLIALIAVSAPGLYPFKALQSATELMQSRRIRFIIRLIALIFVIILTWLVVMLPLILLDLLIKQIEWTAGFPLIPLCMIIMTLFTIIYITTYLYLYYRWLLDLDKEEVAVAEAHKLETEVKPVNRIDYPVEENSKKAKTKSKRRAR